jgi:hypothetical protein
LALSESEPGKMMNSIIRSLETLKQNVRDHGIKALFKKGPWENFASVLIIIGVLMLMQPFALWIFTYSFIVILVGTIGFMIVSHFPE